MTASASASEATTMTWDDFMSTQGHFVITWNAQHSRYSVTSKEIDLATRQCPRDVPMEHVVFLIQDYFYWNVTGQNCLLVMANRPNNKPIAICFGMDNKTVIEPNGSIIYQTSGAEHI